MTLSILSETARKLPEGFSTRFAPSPTGYLHLGHVVNAIWVWGLAAARSGKVLLRIEDHDTGRSRPKYESAILDDLKWLGFIESTETADIWRQSNPQRVRRYSSVIRSLQEKSLTYPCVCSRAEIEAMSASHADGTDMAGVGNDDTNNAGTGNDKLRYPGTCRELNHDAALTMARRIRVQNHTISFSDALLGYREQNPSAQCGDFLLRDRNGNFTYQFAVTVDDMDQNIDVVIRGADLIESVGRQLLLAEILGRRSIPYFVHHPLLKHPDGKKLSKSAGDTGIRELRQKGLSPEEVLGKAAYLGGLLETEHPMTMKK